MYGVHLHSFRLKTGQSCDNAFFSWSSGRFVKSSSSCCMCWILRFVGVLCSLVLLLGLLMCLECFVVSSPSVRNCSSKPSSSTNTIGGTPDTFVAFPSVGPASCCCFRCCIYRTSYQSYGICLPSFKSSMDPAGCSRTVRQSAVLVFGCFLFVSSSRPLSHLL